MCTRLALLPLKRKCEVLGEQLTETGIEVLGTVPWGTHLCQFYENKNDLIEIQVPFFKAGLENNEYCIWTTAEPLGPDSAIEALRAGIPDFDQYLQSGQIEIISQDRWFLEGGVFGRERVDDGWNRRFDRLLRNGYDGLRLCSTVARLPRSQENSITRYENEVDGFVANNRMLAICTYNLDRNAAEVIEIVGNHHAALVRHMGRWQLIENAASKRLERRSGRGEPQDVAGIAVNYRDIIERKRAEDKLLESEARFRGIFDGSNVGIAMCDPVGRILEANSAVFAFLGYSREELLGMHFSELTHPDDLPRDSKLYQSLVSGERDSYVVDHRCITKHGQVFWGRLSVSAVNDEDGRILYTVIVCEDITDHRQAEEALLESETRLREAHQMAKMGRWDLNHTLDRLQWTDTIYEIFEIDREEFGASYGAFLQTVHPDDRQMVDENWNESLATRQPYEIEHRLLTRDGRIKWVSERCRTEFDGQGQPLISVGIVQDITERKRAEALIKTRLALLEYAATHSLAQLLQKTLDEVEALTDSCVGFYHFVDTDHETLSLQAWSTRTLTEFCGAAGSNLHYPINQAGVWADCVREKRPVVHNDYAAVPHRKGTPDGHAAITRELVVPILRGDRIIAVLGVGNKPSDYTEQDVQLVSYLADVAWEIAERKQAEDKLHMAYEEEKRLRRSLEDEARKRLEFSRALVHELKTPLTAVIATSDLLISEMKEEPWASMAANIHRGAEGLSKRIDELLDLARGEIGMLTLNRAPISPHEVLSEIISEMMPVASARNHTLIVKFPESLPVLNVDQVRIRQVVYNLISNACKFTKAGGRITIRAKAEGKELVVEVHDNGVGLTRAEQARLFRPYERLDAPKQRYSGLGLGLALSKYLVELHGGRIWVKSRKGRGSTFGFSVPIDGKPSPQGDQGRNPASRAKG